MPGSLPHLKHGPDSYQVYAQVLGGQLVIPDASDATGTMVGPAGANAKNVLGVAGNDAAPIPNQAGDTTGYGQPLVDISVLPDYVSVYHSADMHVTYTADCDFGALLVADASGTVTPASGNTFDEIVGRCTQPGGVVVATNAVGRARIFG
jgi:hypothetical protein